MKTNHRLFIPAVLLLLASCLHPGSLRADDSVSPKVEGSWKWSFTMPDGTRTEPRAKIRRDGNTLTGTSIPRPGFEAAITEGKIERDLVSWSVIREHQGRKVTTRYSGRLSGTTLKGKIESDWSGQVQSYDWEAKRASDSPAGTWKWEFSFGGQGRGGRSFESRAVLNFDGQSLTGVVKGRTGETPITEATFKEGKISFEVVRDRGGNKVVSRYWGRLDGDTIIGKSETDFGTAEPRTVDWEATRVSE